MTKFIIDDDKVINVPIEFEKSDRYFGYALPGRFISYVKRYNDQRVHPDHPFAEAGAGYVQEDGSEWIDCLPRCIHVRTPYAPKVSGFGDWMLD